MKKLLLSLLIIVGATMTISAQNQDVIYLNNGGIIKGSIIGQNADGSIKIQTADGSIFVYNQSDIKDQAIERMTQIYGKKILDTPKHSFGVRVGGLLTKAFLGELIIDDDPKHTFCPGAYIGGSYEIALNKTRRWFFQTGLGFQYTQGKYEASSSWGFNGFDSYGTEIKTNTLLLEIPIMFAYKFSIGKKLVMYPSIGANYALGLWGDYSHTEYDKYGNPDTEEGNPFIQKEYEYDNPTFYRHGVYVKAMLNLDINKIHIEGGIAYGIHGDYWGMNLGIGYNF